MPAGGRRLAQAGLVEWPGPARDIQALCQSNTEYASLYHACMTTEAVGISKWITDNVARPLAISVFFVLLALLWTFPLQHLIAYPFVFLFLGAIMASAWFGGYIAGSMAVVMSSVLVAFFFVPPLYSMTVGREFHSYVIAFVVCAVAMSGLSSARKRSETAVREAKDELEIRVRERTAELQLSNAELVERERELRLLAEAIPQQLWRTDPQGHLEFCNGNLLEYLGDDIHHLRGSDFSGVIHPEDFALFTQNWTAARTSAEKLEMPARIRGADGTYRWFLIRANPHRGADERILSWYGVHIDIEEQHRAQQALLVAQDDLSRLSRTLSMAEVAASIAHELNQPLTAVISDAHACRRWLSAQPPNVERAVTTSERIVRECTRAAAVVSRVRSLFSKGEYTREATDINGIIRELSRLLREEAIRRNVAFKLRLDDGLPLLQVDPVQMQQVLLNLATNGMDAMQDTLAARELEICSEMQGAREVMITVRDYGCGLSEDARTRLFAPFFTTKPDGTGMGLAICRSIIEAHGGRIWAESLDRGAAFRFTLAVNA